MSATTIRPGEIDPAAAPPVPPPCPPKGGCIGDFTWIPEVDHRRGLIGLHMAHGQYRAAQLHSSLWLSPDDAEKVGKALLAAVASWRGR